jgi:hypothetical protein
MGFMNIDRNLAFAESRPCAAKHAPLSYDDPALIFLRNLPLDLPM